MGDIHEVAAELGITYRQLDYWCAEGYVPDLDVAPGSGFRRTFTDEQTAHLRVMASLVRDGVRPSRATQLAARIVAGEPAAIGGFQLTKAGAA